MLKSQLLFGLFIFFIAYNEVQTRVNNGHSDFEEDLAWAKQNSDNDVKLERRVIGGLKAGEAQFPFLGYLEYSGALWCAVSIIHRRWLLTAAHCLDMSNVHNARITLGTNQYRGTNGKIYAAQQFYSHSGYYHIPEELNYGLEYVVNDIGLILLDRDIHFNDRVNPIRIPRLGDTRDHGGEFATIAGWGSFYLDSPIPNDLLTTSFEVLSTNECRRSWTYIKNDHLCTIVNFRSSVCYGDSGGPLISTDGVQIGVVSTADTDCGFVKPNLFTKIGSYVPWIKRTLLLHHDSI